MTMIAVEVGKLLPSSKKRMKTAAVKFAPFDVFQSCEIRLWNPLNIFRKQKLKSSTKAQIVLFAFEFFMVRKNSSANHFPRLKSWEQKKSRKMLILNRISLGLVDVL